MHKCFHMVLGQYCDTFIIHIANIIFNTLLHTFVFITRDYFVLFAAGVEVNNLTSPVVLTLYNQHQARKGSRPVYWDFLAQGRHYELSGMYTGTF